MSETLEFPVNPLPPARSPATDAWAAIADALQGLQFGEVTIIVQDGVVVQVERTEKKRLRTRSG